MTISDRALTQLSHDTSHDVEGVSFERLQAMDAETKHDPKNGQFSSGGSSNTENDDMPDLEKKFPKGTKVKENRQGAVAHKVVGHSGNMLHLSNGLLMHYTKAVRA